MLVRRFKGLLISSALIAAFLVGAPAAYADPGNGNSANAPGQNKDASAGQQTATANSTSQTSTSTQANSDHSQGNAGTWGTYNQPQPFSNADQNNTGANGTSSSNPFISTRDGSASLNGNGAGLAVGRPCAGCVGKADNKNPKGQSVNDKNNGFKCDSNNGIGKTNPAHTGCAAVVSPVGCTVNCTTNNPCVPSALVSCVPGRGAGQPIVLASALLTAASPGGAALPNTGMAESTNWWVIASIVSFLVATLYWRQFIVTVLPKRP